MYYVYVLHSLKDENFYVGYSTDIERRLQSHLSGRVTSTKQRLPMKLIYYEAYIDRADAKGRELFLKSGSGLRFLKRQLRHYLNKT